MPPLTDEERAWERSECEACPTCQADRDVLQRGLAAGEEAHWRALLAACHDDPMQHAGPCRVPRACGHSDAEMLRRSRPCILTGCRHNNYLDLTERGNISFTFPNREPWEMPAKDSCSLDAAEAGARTLRATGLALGMTRERVRQITLELGERLEPLFRALGVDPRDIGRDAPDGEGDGHALHLPRAGVEANG